MTNPEASHRQTSEIALSRLAAIIESSDDAIIGKDLNGIITSWNRGAEMIFGYTAEEIVGTLISRLIPADLQEEEDYIIGKIRRGEKVDHYETVRQTKDGRRIDVSITASPIKDAAGNIVGASKIARDITALKAQEREILRLSRLYAGLSQINQAIVWTRDRQELLDKVCRVLVEFGKFSMAWIGQPDAETRRVQVIARWGDKTDLLSQVIIYADDRPEGQGPTGTAINRGAPEVRNHFTDDRHHPQWDDHAIRAGLHAAAAFPIRQDGKIWGALTVYSEEPGFFRDKEIALLVEAAGDVSFALDFMVREHSLREKEADLEEAQRIAKLGNWRYDLASNRMLWSEELYSIFEIEPAEFKGAYEDFINFVLPDDLPKVRQTSEAASANGTSFQVEYRIQTRSGALKHIHEIGYARKDAAGKVVGLFGTAQDITEQKQVEESLRLLNSAVLQAKESVVITDAQLDFPGPRIIFANPAFTQMTGYTAEEVIGKTPRILQGPRTDKNVLARLRKTLERGEVFEGETTQYRKDGTEYEQEWRITPLRDDAGHITHFVAIQRDVSAHRKLEAQLRQSQKMEAFGQLAGGVAHDFNNILAVIQLQAGLLRMESTVSLQQLELASEIEKAAERGANLTRQLLLFSRKQTMQPRNLKLKDVVDNMTKMLARTVGEQFDLQFKFAEEPLVVHADPGMIDQILLNLVVNARDAMPEGGKIIIETSAAEFDEITATQNSKARPGLFVCLSVTDIGNGIPPEILPRIFEPFFTTKEVGKGTGLGLATIFGIVQQHEGWINVYSEVGHGSTFRIYLPRQTKVGDTEFFRVVRSSLEGGSETILLVEDEVAVRTSVRMALSRLGYRVLEAPNGAEGLKVWQQHRHEIALLLTDLVMPGGMTGKELARQLLTQNPNLKVIFASGYSAEVADKELMLVERVNFLAKPFKAHELAKTIRELLDQTV